MRYGPDISNELVVPQIRLAGPSGGPRVFAQGCGLRAEEDTGLRNLRYRQGHVRYPEG